MTALSVVPGGKAVDPASVVAERKPAKRYTFEPGEPEIVTQLRQDAIYWRTRCLNDELRASADYVSAVLVAVRDAGDKARDTCSEAQKAREEAQRPIQDVEAFYEAALREIQNQLGTALEAIKRKPAKAAGRAKE